MAYVTRVQIAKFEKMKAKRQKHKTAKARSIAARAAKKLQRKADSESETSDVATVARPPKKKLKLGRSTSRKLPSQHSPLTKPQTVDVQEENRLKRQGKSPKEPKIMGVKSNPKPKLVGTGKKRKRGDNLFTPVS